MIRVIALLEDEPPFYPFLTHTIFGLIFPSALSSFSAYVADVKHPHNIILPPPCIVGKLPECCFSRILSWTCFKTPLSLSTLGASQTGSFNLGHMVCLITQIHLITPDIKTLLQKLQQN